MELMPNKLLNRIKDTYRIYQKVSGINQTIEYRQELKDVIRELDHYPKKILIMTTIEALKGKISDDQGNYSKKDLMQETLDLISYVHYMMKKIDINAKKHIFNNEVH
jgi:hypothetical protein